jgi:hypothetical protein
MFVPLPTALGTIPHSWLIANLPRLVLPGRGANESDHETARTVVWAEGVEVHERADADWAHAEVGQDLGVVVWK